GNAFTRESGPVAGITGSGDDLIPERKLEFPMPRQFFEVRRLVLEDRAELKVETPLEARHCKRTPELTLKRVQLDGLPYPHEQRIAAGRPARDLAHLLHDDVSRRDFLVFKIQERVFVAGVKDTHLRPHRLKVSEQLRI